MKAEGDEAGLEQERMEEEAQAMIRSGMDPEFELVKAWQEGDKEAAGRLFDLHFPMVYRFFKNKADPQDVDDLVQQTFVGVLQGKDRFRNDASIKTYLIAIAKRRLYSYWASRSRQKKVEVGASSVQDMSPSPSSLVARRQTDRALLDALRRIPLDLQVVLELHYWEEMTGPQLAGILDIPEGTVRSRLRRGLEALNKILATSQRLASTVTDLDGWAEALRAMHLTES